MENLDIEVGDDVVEFLRGALIGLGVGDPVATLIYGRFSDEAADNFRIAISERSQLSAGASGNGTIYRVPKLGELYVPNKFVASVRGKLVAMQSDLVILSDRD